MFLLLQELTVVFLLTFDIKFRFLMTLVLLNVSHLNVQSLVSKIVDIKNLIVNFNILAINETWLNPNI